MSRQAPREPRVVFGFHAVLARLRADPKSVVEVFLDETRNDGRAKDLAAVAERAGVRVMRVPTKRLDGFYGGGRHQGIVARVRPRDEHADLDEILARLQEPRGEAQLQRAHGGEKLGKLAVLPHQPRHGEMLRGVGQRHPFGQQVLAHGESRVEVVAEEIEAWVSWLLGAGRHGFPRIREMLGAGCET